MKDMWRKPTEYGMVEHFPPRVRWHVTKTLEGMYGMVLSDMRTLPVVDEAELVRLEETYGYLTKYYAEGVEDPKRSTILRGIGQSLMKQLRANASAIELEEQSSGRCRAVERLQAFGLSASDLPRLVERMLGEAPRYSQLYFDLLDQIFTLVWCSLDSDALQLQTLRATLLADDSDELPAMNLVGALFLGAMEYFDAGKIELLLELYQHHESLKVRGGALAALLMLGRRHEVELEQLYPELTEEVRMAIMADEEQVMEALSVVHASYNTTEDHKTFKEKILPGLKSISDKLQQVMGNSLSLRLEELQNGTLDEELSEEVTQLMESSKARFSLFNNKGQDVAFHLVAELKTFPFFSTVSHWFLPFTEEYPSLNRENVEAFRQLIPMMMGGLPLISSDLYSYAFVPVWEEIGRSVAAQMEEAPMPQATPKAVTLEDGVRELVFGAYRFYQLSHLSLGLINPFAKSPHLLSGAFLSKERQVSEEGLLSLASMLVSYRQYVPAGYTYQRVAEEYLTDTAEVWRGQAVASMLRREDEKALMQLRKAIECEGKREVTVRRIAQLLVRLSRPKEAIKWLEESEEELKEVSYKLPLLRAKLCYEVGAYEEALSATYKADYLSGSKEQAIYDLLLELLLRLGRADEAKVWLERSSSDFSTQQLWSGVTSIALGDKEEGLAHLRQWTASGTKGIELSDKLALLRAYGMEPWELGLIQDIVYRESKR